jgi:hypothetical protein
MDLFSLPPLSKNRNPSTGIKWNLLPVIGTVYHVELGRHNFVCVSLCVCLSLRWWFHGFSSHLWAIIIAFFEDKGPVKLLFDHRRCRRR